MQHINNNLRHKSGFTMIELLVVATIIIILSTIGLISYNQMMIGSRNAKRKQDLESIRQALLLYRSDNGCYPTAGTGDATDYRGALAPTLAVGGYLSTPLPDDPKPVTLHYGYKTSGTCKSTNASAFEISATLEGNPATTYTVTSP